MKVKRVNNFIYEGLGFPIELKSVQMVKVHGEWWPKIDIRKIAESVMRTLPFQQERLTGNQIKFIRTYFEMSLRDFAKKVVKESHTAVSKWEHCGDKATSMDINIEKMLRLYIFDQTVMEDKKQQKAFHELYQILRDIDLTSKKPSPILMKAV